MEKILIKSKYVKVYGKKMILPIDGEVTISENGELEVSKECTNLLLQSENYELVESKNLGGLGGIKGSKKEKLSDAKNTQNTKVIEEEDDQEDEDDDSNDSEDDENDEDESYTKEQLEELEISDLLDIVKSSGVAKNKYAKIAKDKEKLIEYILSNI